MQEFSLKRRLLVDISLVLVHVKKMLHCDDWRYFVPKNSSSVLGLIRSGSPDKYLKLTQL